MKKFVAAVLLATTGACALAAPVTLNTSTFDITYDDALLSGATVSLSGGSLVFTGLENVGDLTQLSSLNGILATVTAKAGYQLNGFSGLFSADYAYAPFQAGVVALELSTFWDKDVNEDTQRSTTVIFPASGSGEVSVLNSVSFVPGTTLANLLHVDVNAVAEDGVLTPKSISLSIQTSAVPEPESMGLALAGLLVAGGVSLSRRRKAQ